MWIKNYNMLVDVKYLEAIGNELYGAITDDNKLFLLGEYANEERAREVLDEITHHIEVGNLKVYQMPEE